MFWVKKVCCMVVLVVWVILCFLYKVNIDGLVLDMLYFSVLVFKVVDLMVLKLGMSWVCCGLIIMFCNDCLINL